MSSTASPFAVAAALALAVAPLSARPQGEPLSPYQVATTRSVATAEISPDGEHVAYVLSVPRTPGEDRFRPVARLGQVRSSGADNPDFDRYLPNLPVPGL